MNEEFVNESIPNDDEYVNYYLAVKLKELRFIEPCFAVWYKSSSDGYSLQVNPLKLDDIYDIEPLATFQNNFNRVDAMDSIIKYNFNEFFDDVDAEGNKFDPVYSAPLYQQVTKWLRNNHKVDISIIPNYKNKQPIETKTYRCGIIYVENNLIESFFIRPTNNKFDFIEFETYEQALNTAILESLKLIKK